MRRIELQRDITRSEGHISDLRKERDAKLLQLRATLDDAEGRAADSIRNIGIREQMADVAARYASDIDAEQADLQALYQRQAEIGQPRSWFCPKLMSVRK